MLTCPICGVELPAGTPAENCPNCILSFAVCDSHTIVRDEIDGLAALHAGKKFGGYELFEEIARGGMGVVYKARQKSLDRMVAVKMILAGQLPGKQMAQRFREEAAAAGMLRHPNIVAIHEIGMHEGQHFFSMDYVDGQNLAQLVGNRPLLAQRAARYVKLIAEAIHYAHQKGVLHRDLKPWNVLKTRRPTNRA